MIIKRFNLRSVVVIAVCLAVIMIFASCGKEREIKSKEAVFLLEEIQSSNGERSVYEYDKQDRITKYTEYGSNGQPNWVGTYTYNAEGDLVEYKDNDIQVAYAQNGNKITFVDDEGEYTEIELNDQEFPVKSTSEWGNENGMYWYKSTITFTWQNENLIKMEMEDEWKIGSNKHSETISITYTYDDMKAPLYHCKAPKWFLACEGYDINNNKKTEKEGTFDVAYEYTYNDDGFPVTRKESNNSITDTFIYRKK